MSEVKSDIQIAREAKMQPINDILAKINVPDESAAFSPMGRHIAKINLEYLDTLKDKPDGKLVLVTAITPTPAGEGKTTTSVGLNDGLNKIGKKSIVCLREPSLGPSFGMKGGAAGGGYAQVVPMEPRERNHHLQLHLSYQMKAQDLVLLIIQLIFFQFYLNHH